MSHRYVEVELLNCYHCVNTRVYHPQLLESILFSRGIFPSQKTGQGSRQTRSKSHLRAEYTPGSDPQEHSLRQDPNLRSRVPRPDVYLGATFVPEDMFRER
ncbi:hypothetical protein ABVK25_002590 [Lepraria finkii]|uniref:Uncharacterized protein n=1 Tax=Lepraria finkii TaxID=1340010 RepID=A0ABR4BJ54_9LECA